MKKLQLNMLLNSCQNQWRSVILHNKYFKVKLYGPNGYLFTLDSNYSHDDNYYEYRECEVSFWEFRKEELDEILIIELTW